MRVKNAHVITFFRTNNELIFSLKKNFTIHTPAFLKHFFQLWGIVSRSIGHLAP